MFEAWARLRSKAGWVGVVGDGGGWVGRCVTVMRACAGRPIMPLHSVPEWSLGCGQVRVRARRRQAADADAQCECDCGGLCVWLFVCLLVCLFVFV